MGWSDKVNAIFDKFYGIIDDAGIKNTRDITIKLYKRSLPAEFSTTTCPAVAIVKDNVMGKRVSKDQATLETPTISRIIVGISDYSQVGLDDADALTDDLIDKIVTAINTNPSLDGLVKGIDFLSVDYDYDRRDGVWFSEPTLIFTMEGSNFE